MGRGEDVLECLDTLAKGGTLNNFFTLHNDYRKMGVTLDWDPAVVQLDANMGFVNAVQKMVFDERKDVIKILPALSERIKKGSADRLRFTKGKVSLKWNESTVTVKISFTRDGKAKLLIPNGYNISDNCTVENGYIVLNGKKGDVFTVRATK
jgi:alpha-L-fucosidase 2